MRGGNCLPAYICTMAKKAYLLLGSNMGNRQGHLAMAVNKIHAIAGSRNRGLSLLPPDIKNSLVFLQFHAGVNAVAGGEYVAAAGFAVSYCVSCGLFCLLDSSGV